VASAADAVVVTHFDLTIGRETSQLSLCLPLSRLLPVLTVKPRESANAGLHIANPALRERLSDVPLDLRVRFADTAIDSSVVLGLSVGDVIPLNHRVGAPLAILAGGSPVAHAVAGRSGVKLAALVVDATAPVKNQKEI
jgi:flagellar motor switch protein FliM